MQASTDCAVADTAIPGGFLLVHRGLRTSGRGCQLFNISDHCEIHKSAVSIINICFNDNETRLYNEVSEEYKMKLSYVRGT